MDELFLRELVESRAEEMRAEVARNRMARAMRATKVRAFAEIIESSPSLFARLRFFARNEERDRNSKPQEVCCA